MVGGSGPGGTIVDGTKSSSGALLISGFKANERGLSLTRNWAVDRAPISSYERRRKEAEIEKDAWGNDYSGPSNTISAERVVVDAARTLVGSKEDLHELIHVATKQGEEKLLTFLKTLADNNKA